MIQGLPSGGRKRASCRPARLREDDLAPKRGTAGDALPVPRPAAAPRFEIGRAISAGRKQRFADMLGYMEACPGPEIGKEFGEIREVEDHDGTARWRARAELVGLHAQELYLRTQGR